MLAYELREEETNKYNVRMVELWRCMATQLSARGFRAIKI